MTITDKIDAITGIPEDRLREVLPAPRSVKIELSGRCNFNCSFCARRKGLRDENNYFDMQWGLFTRLLLEMRDAGVEEIGLFYLGEPFIDSRFEEAVDFAKNTAGYPYVFATTNGSMANYLRVYEAYCRGLDSLKFSFNYANEDQFVEIAQVKPKLWYAMLKNLKAARRARDDAYEKTGNKGGLYASYIEYDGEQGERIRELVETIKPVVDEVYALPLYTMASHTFEDSKDKDWKPTQGNRGRLGNLRASLPCWSCFTEGHIRCDGKMSACCFDSDDRLVMADLTEVSFMDGWNSLAFQELRRANLSGDVTGSACEMCIAVGD